VDRRHGERQREGGDRRRIASTRRLATRATGLKDKRDDRVRAGPDRPAAAAPRGADGADRSETSRRTTAGRRRPATVRGTMIKGRATTRICSSTTFTSQLARESTSRPAPRRRSGRRAIFGGRPRPSPSNDYFLVSTIQASLLAPDSDERLFRRTSRSGIARARSRGKIADRPSPRGHDAHGRSSRGRAGLPLARRFSRRRSSGPRALDGGRPEEQGPLPRQSRRRGTAPFQRDSRRSSRRRKWRFTGNFVHREKGVALLSESDRASRHVAHVDPRDWRGAAEAVGPPAGLGLRQPGHADDAGATPATGVAAGRGGGGGRPDRAGRATTSSLTGPGSSPEGDRPFLDRLNLKTLQTERVFRSASGAYETVVAPLDDQHEPVPDALRVADRAARTTTRAIATRRRRSR